MARRKISGPQPFEVTAKQDAQVTEMIEQADREILEQRVNMRLGKPQLDVIKEAAAAYGVPYQTYLKEAAFRQALADLRQYRGIVDRDREKGSDTTAALAVNA